MTDWDAKLKEWSAACEAATGGPWEVDGDGRDICCFRDRLGAANGQPPYEITENNGFSRNSMAADAAFIALARTALPLAVQRIRELEAALERIAAGNPAPARKWLSDIEMASIARAALGEHSGRNNTHPCTFCAAPASPHHELVTIGKYCNGKSLTRPVCAKCMPIARAIVASGEQP